MAAAVAAAEAAVKSTAAVESSPEPAAMEAATAWTATIESAAGVA